MGGEGLAVSVLVGNPKPSSRTLASCRLVAELIAGGPPTTVVDVATLGPAVLRWGDPQVEAAVEAIRHSDVVVVGSPTYKATYTGVLKAFLDQVPGDGLTGVAAVPLMLGAGPRHALAPEVHLRPVLVELGASCPTRAIYVEEGDHLDEAGLRAWLAGTPFASGAPTAAIGQTGS